MPITVGYCRKELEGSVQIVENRFSAKVGPIGIAADNQAMTPARGKLGRSARGHLRFWCLPVASQTTHSALLAVCTFAELRSRP
jgi:hypothetical protein